MSDETPDKKVGTAVEFLKAVDGQGHREQQLRSYLKKKQGLSNEEIEKAFQEHRSQRNINETTVGMQDKTDWTLSVDKMGATSKPSDRKVETAVEFLIEAFENKEGNNEQKLRSYLANRRGLSSKQIEEAFRICRIRQDVKPSANAEEKTGDSAGTKHKSADWNVETVVEFLIEVGEREEDYPEQKLRQYLVNRRGLSTKQIDKAFRIYRIRHDAKEKSLANTEEKSNEKVFSTGVQNAAVATNVEKVVDKGSIGLQDIKNEEKETCVVTSVDRPVSKIETGVNEPSATFRTWSADLVTSWVEALESGKFKAYATHFQENDVDGALLSVLSNSELTYFFEKDLKIQNAAVRNELAHAVRSKTKNLLDVVNLEESREKTEPNLDEICVSLQYNDKAE